MKCIEIIQNKLVLAERDKPKAKKGQVLIKVHRAGVNRADILQKRGSFDPPEGITDIPGLEVSGEIIALGRGANSKRGFLPRLRKGMKVTALVTGGGYAEYCTAPATQCLPIPKGMDYSTAAGAIETFATIWISLFGLAKLKKGETLLVHGGSSGIGTTAIQLAKAFGIKIFVTSGGNEKCKKCKKLGADLAIDYNTENFAREVMKATKGRGVDVVLDMIGGDYVDRNLEILVNDGRCIIIGTQHGADVEINLLDLMRRRLKLIGSTLRNRSLEEKATIINSLYKEVWPLMKKQNSFFSMFSKKRITPIVDKEFNLSDAQEAHDYLDGGTHFGKVILKVV